MVEGLNRTLKKSVQTLQLTGEPWEDAVVMALGNCHSTPHSATPKTPAELMLGRRIRASLNAAFVSPANDDQKQLVRRQKYQEKYRHDGISYAPGTFVRVRHSQFKKGDNALGKTIKVETVRSPGTYRLADKTNISARRLYITSQIEILPPPVASVQH